MKSGRRTEGLRGRATRNSYRLRYRQSVTGASSTVNADGVRPLTRDSKPQSPRPSCPWLLQNGESHAKLLSDTVSPTVDVLRERSVLTVFTTGHETLVLPETHASMPRGEKPVDMRPQSSGLAPPKRQGRPFSFTATKTNSASVTLRRVPRPCRSTHTSTLRVTDVRPIRIGSV